MQLLRLILAVLMIAGLSLPGATCVAMPPADAAHHGSMPCHQTQKGQPCPMTACCAQLPEPARLAAPMLRIATAPTASRATPFRRQPARLLDLPPPRRAI